MFEKGMCIVSTISVLINDAFEYMQYFYLNLTYCILFDVERGAYYFTTQMMKPEGNATTSPTWPPCHIQTSKEPQRLLILNGAYTTVQPRALPFVISRRIWQHECMVFCIITVSNLVPLKHNLYPDELFVCTRSAQVKRQVDHGVQSAPHIWGTARLSNNRCSHLYLF